jgi:hypothetical protein
VLRAIAGRHAQIAQINRSMKISELPARGFGEVGRKSFRDFTPEHSLGEGIPESPDHVSMYHPMIQSQDMCIIE